MYATTRTALAILNLAGQLAGIATGVRVGRVDDRRVEYQLTRNGSPTVVMEAGLGDGMKSWAPIINHVAIDASVFVYNRAGYGRSSRSGSPRTGERIVEELRADLKALNVQPPYVLVGHSIGGTYMQLFAQRYPDEVAGLVLVDSRPADMTRRCRAELKDAPCDPPALARALMTPAARAEYDAGDATFDKVRSGGSLRDIPLVVITAAKHKEGGGFAELWSELQGDLVRQSSRGRQIIARNSGHYVQRDEPQLVIDAIRDLYAGVSGR